MAADVPAGSGTDRVAKLVTAALNNQLQRVRELTADPVWLEHGPPEAWAVLGDAEQLRSLLAADKGAAMRRYGSRERELLLYVAFSHCHKLEDIPDSPSAASGQRSGPVVADPPVGHQSEVRAEQGLGPYRKASGGTCAAGLVECARLLLAAGADPNAAYDAGPPWEGAMQTALYGATGHANHPELARVLLAAGADPNDDESLYHSAEHMYEECLDLLLEFGADVSRRSPHWNNTPLFFLACYKERDANVATANAGFRWLLEHGADPNVLCEDTREAALHIVARLNRDVELARLLLAHGAEVSLPRGDGLTAYALAMRYGNTAVQELLLEHGAQLSEAGRTCHLLGACSRGERDEALRLAQLYPDVAANPTRDGLSVLPEAADEGRAAAVDIMLELGFDPATPGRFGATALHLAAFRGDTETTAVILKYNPPLELEDPDFHATPLGWCGWASVNNPAPGADYPATARLLKEAGASTEIDFTGTPEVCAVLGLGPA